MGSNRIGHHFAAQDDHDVATQTLPRPAFVACPCCFGALPWWQAQLYQAAYEQARAAVRRRSAYEAPFSLN